MGYFTIVILMNYLYILSNTQNLIETVPEYDILDMGNCLGLTGTTKTKRMAQFDVSKNHASERSNEKKLRSNLFQLVNDPWLNPVEGALATVKTKVYTVYYDSVGKVTYTEIPNVISYVTEYSEIINKAKIRSNRRKQHSINRYASNAKFLKSPTTQSSSSGAPSVVYPELAIAVTFDFYELFNFNVWSLIPYLLSFWNAVDMRYRSLENPKFRLNIAKIIIETEPAAFTFLTPHSLNSKYVTANSIMNAREFWYAQNKSIPMHTYDIMITMTSRLICSSLDKSSHECGRQIFGQTWSSGACRINHGDRGIDKVAIVHDNGVYKGVVIAAHELGHLLGANDDGVSFYNYTTKEWGPAQCDMFGGYIMSGSLRELKKAFDWSNCTLNRLEKFINSKGAECLYNKPNGLRHPIARILPGKLMDADEQCRRNGAIESCEGEISNCVILQCLFEDQGCVNLTLPAVEGTPCGLNYIGRICIHGECVDEAELLE